VANFLYTFTVETLLGLHLSTNACPADKRRATIAQMTIDLLTQYAPDILTLQPAATWSSKQQADLQAELSQLVDDHDRRDVRNAIAHVIECGRLAGIWNHRPWPLRSIVQLAPSAVSRADINAIRRADHRREQFLQVLPMILNSGDEMLLTGALIVAAVDCSAVLQANLLEQLLDRDLEFHAKSGLVWADLRLGSIHKPWRNVRRWHLDALSQLLANKMVELRQDKKTGHVDVKKALGKLAKCLDIPTGELTMTALIQSARAWWSLQVPSCLIDYAVRPAISMSLPATAWQRLLTGKPLCKSIAPLAVRELERSDRAVLKEMSIIGDAREDDRISQTKSDFFTQHAAIKALMKALRRPCQEKKLNSQRIGQRLKAWSEEYAHVEGWIPLFEKWVRSILLERKEGPFGRDISRRASGLLRYLVGFASRFLKYFWDYTIGTVNESIGDWARRMHYLRLDIAQLTSASVSKSALSQFLRFIEYYGAPRTEFGEDWRIVVSASEADANLFTPAEYIRLQAWIKLQYQGVENTYPALRAQTLLVLAFRCGLRWEELSNLRLQDCVLADDLRQRCGSIWIRRNDFSDGKNSEFYRTLSIEHFLSFEERKLLATFYAMAVGLGGGERPGKDMLFADPGCLSLPPTKTETHDLIQRGMRIVSGDPSLVFHHLRHSAACFMFLRVMTDETEDRFPFPWLTGWEHVSSKAVLGAECNYVTALSGRGPSNASRLYLVSEMMGHLDPDTSLRSYIHFLDIVMQRHTTAIQDLPTDLLATLEGVKMASIKRRAYRESKMKSFQQKESAH